MLLIAVATAILAALPAGADGRRYTIAFANLTEEPGVMLEGTGFTGREVRESFALAARRLPIDLVFYDNRRDARAAVANAADAVRRKADLYVEYFDDPAANDAVARTMREAHSRPRCQPSGRRRAALHRRQRGGRTHRGRGAR